MAKCFKLRIYQVISSSLQSCRSKDSTALPLDPVPSFFQLSPPNLNIIKTSIPPPSSKSSSSSIKRHVSSAFISVGCGLPCKSNSSTTEIPKDLEWKKEEEEWEIVISPHDHHTKLNNSSTETITPPTATNKKRRTRKKKTTTTTITKHRGSTSSADNDSALFSSDETEKLKQQTDKILISSSSRSFSMDSNSTDFNPHLETIREKPRHKKKKKKRTSKKRCVSNKGLLMCRSSVSDEECEVQPARLSVFKRLIPCAVEGKVKESFAVVKKSDHPYDDFKKSMMDMIWEKQLFEEAELEQLLQCFLSLNSRHHHRLIVDVFSEIWNAMFSNAAASPPPTTSSS